MKPENNLKHMLKMRPEHHKKVCGPKDTKKEIDIVIFVQAAPDRVPEKLMTAVREATRPDEQGARSKYRKYERLQGLMSKGQEVSIESMRDYKA